MFRFLILALTLLSALHASPRQRLCFDHSWSFHNGDVPNAHAADFDASAWRVLDLPHDMSIEPAPDAKSAAGAPGGYLPGGMAWYRKTFRLPVPC